MKKPIVIGNWKATKTIEETGEWAKYMKEELKTVDNGEIIVCPPFNSIPLLVSRLEGTKIKVGAQDVSKFKKGSYTGEVTVEMLVGLVSYCIVGHSERRKYFGETDDDVIEKVNNLIEYSIKPILCVSNLDQLGSYLDRGKTIVDKAEEIIFVYEPPSAISGGGSYKPNSPEDAAEGAKKIGVRLGKNVTTLYGGSINPENAKEFFSKESIDGGLVGQASLDPQTFVNIFKK